MSGVLVMGASSFAIANLVEQPSKSTRDISALAGRVDMDALTLRLQDRKSVV